MIGPHYERMAQIDQRLSSKQMLARIKQKNENPLTNLIEKIKRQFSDYDTAYNEDVINHNISSIDKLLAHDGKLGPILSFIQKENTTLRRQLSMLQSQLSNAVGICEQIINENGQLKEIIHKKNEDIRKIIQTIAINESQVRNQLQDKLALLQQQNSILISHLNSIKKQQIQYNNKQKMKQKQINNLNNKLQEYKKQLNQVIKNEHNLSRKLSLNQHNLYQQTQKNYDLELINQNLKFDINTFKNQLLMFKDQGKLNSVQNIKHKLQIQYKNILDQHRQLKHERVKILRDSQTLKIQNQKLYKKTLDNERILNQLQNDLSLTTSLLNEQKQKTTIMSSTMGKLQIKIDELKDENSRLLLEIDSVNSYSISKQNSLQREIGELKKQLEQKSNETEKILRQVREKTRLLIQQKDIEMDSLNQTNKQLRRMLQMNKQ